MGINKLPNLPGAVYKYTGEVQRFNTDTDMIDSDFVNMEATNAEIHNESTTMASSLGEILQFIFVDHGAKFAIGKKISMIEMIWKDEHGKHILVTDKNRSLSACFDIIHEFSTSNFMSAAAVKHTVVIEKEKGYVDTDYEILPSSHELFANSPLHKLINETYGSEFFKKFMRSNPKIFAMFKYSDYLKRSDEIFEGCLEECAERLIDTLPEVFHHITARKPITKKEEEE